MLKWQGKENTLSVLFHTGAKYNCVKVESSHWYYSEKKGHNISKSKWIIETNE